MVIAENIIESMANQITIKHMIDVIISFVYLVSSFSDVSNDFINDFIYDFTISH